MNVKDENNKKEKTQTIDREEANRILDRIIGFINNCDNKASIVLSIYGVVLTIIFTINGITSLKMIFKAVITVINFWNILYVILFLLFLSILFFGLFELISVLFAKTNSKDLKIEKQDLHSNIFFGDIANKSYKQYKSKMLHRSEEEEINDILVEIYINSVICTSKFKRYNIGIKLSLIGFVGFLITFTIGNIMFSCL